MKSVEHVDYGVDAPTLIRNFYVAGVVLLVISFFLSDLSFLGLKLDVQRTAIIFSIIFIVEASLMLLYSKKGKFKHRDRILNLLDWTGEETVLDVGTGLGLLMNGVANRLATGKVIGIDIWSKSDLSKNTAARAKLNAKLEGVLDKIEIKTQSILSTDFSDAFFDVVVSNLCLHNIPKKEERRQACREIYRILKQNGTAIISDLKHHKEYEEVFQSLGMNTKKIGTYYFDTFPPLTIIKAVKR